MGTTRIKVIDLSSDKKEIKTSRKHAEKLAGIGKLEKEEAKEKAAKVSKAPEVSKTEEKPEDSQITEKLTTESIQRPTSMPSKRRARQRGKKYLDALSLIDRSKTYPIGDALSLLTKTSITKFDPTVEVHFNVTEKNLKGSVNLPHPLSQKKEKKVLVFSDLSTEASAKVDKRIIWGDEKTIAQIEGGQLKPNRDFDVVLSSAKFMAHLAKVAKILGPAGLMPNPKNGTVVEDVAKALEALKTDTFEFKTDSVAQVIHTKIGKLSDKEDQLLANFKTLVSSIGPTKIKKTTVKTTMSPGIKIDAQSSVL